MRDLNPWQAHYISELRHLLSNHPHEVVEPIVAEALRRFDDDSIDWYTRPLSVFSPFIALPKYVAIVSEPMTWMAAYTMPPKRITLRNSQQELC
jgi:hypothetical protein